MWHFKAGVQNLALSKLGCLVLAGIMNHTPANLDVLEGMGGDSNEKKTETLLDGKEKTEILDSPQHLEVPLLGADNSKM
jgi:hypothetical protein